MYLEMASNEIMFYRRIIKILISQLPQLIACIISLDKICSQTRSKIIKIAFIFQTVFAKQKSVL